ncbi:MAG TPA: NAD(P)H-dependent glycerol-3-phosphate dehydrogenase [Syntrophomonadaceae bacterium]|nr:NAD(P)H-dependent glycerol-3-phosphate dehydrogenase [Syntrophomonadaceae bacterium]HPR94030.1 NAD(P)H-dependent glycerol-3-phosphate dehydrogenase [Syntrophomonadaceae bacterium]
MEKICILGAGSWGTAQALLLSSNCKQLSLWSRPEAGLESFIAARENKKYLPGAIIPDNVSITLELKAAVENSGMVVLAVPSQGVRETLCKLKPLLHKEMYLVNTAKGLELNTGMRMSQVAEDVLGSSIKNRYAVLSGPSHAEEVAVELPTAVTVAAYKKETAFDIQDTYISSHFRVYTNPDVAGVELGGALKNIVAIAAGIAQGLGYGDNTKAAIITRGLNEMIRMAGKMGTDPRTLYGLSGLGDLVVTCGSRHSRNHQAGFLIGQGQTPQAALEKTGMVVEGFHTTKVVYELARAMNIEMPIVKACYYILYEDRPPAEEVELLMTRRKKHEIEEAVEDSLNW